MMLTALVTIWCCVSVASYRGGPAEPAPTQDGVRRIELWVSPTGSDSASGTSSTTPFKTPQRAADAVAALPRPLPSGGVTVHISPGMYELNQTLQFDTRHSGTSSDARVSFVASESTGAEAQHPAQQASPPRVRFLGGIVVPHADAAAHVDSLSGQRQLPPIARVVDLHAAGVRDFGRQTPRGGCCNPTGASGCPSSGPLTVSVGGTLPVMIDAIASVSVDIVCDTEQSVFAPPLS